MTDNTESPDTTLEIFRSIDAKYEWAIFSACKNGHWMTMNYSNDCGFIQWIDPYVSTNHGCNSPIFNHNRTRIQFETQCNKNILWCVDRSINTYYAIYRVHYHRSIAHSRTGFKEKYLDWPTVSVSLYDFNSPGAANEYEIYCKPHGILSNSTIQKQFSLVQILMLSSYLGAVLEQ